MAVQNISLIGRSVGFGANAGTTASFDSTGATLLVVYVNATAASGTIAVTDSKSNTWTSLTAQTFSGNQKSVFHYAANPTVGSAHTFTATLTGGFPIIQAFAFIGAKTSSPFDVENGAVGTGSQTTIQPGSITPTQNGDLIICGITTGGAFATTGNVQIDYEVASIYTNGQGITSVGGTNYGMFTAWAVQQTAGATNPTFTLDNGSGINANMTANIAAFKAADAATGGSGGAWAFA